MAWQTFAPRSKDSIPEGRIRINKTGVLSCRTFELTRIRVKDKCVMQFDPDLGCIAVCMVTDGMPITKVRYSKGLASAMINVAGLLKRMGLEDGKAVGEYEIMTKQDRLVITLGTAGKKL